MGIYVGVTRQDQVRGSGSGDALGNGYRDNMDIINVQAATNTLHDDLNHIRTALKSVHGGSAWYDVQEAVSTRLTTKMMSCASAYASLDGGYYPLREGAAVCILTRDKVPSIDWAGNVGRIAMADSRKIVDMPNASMYYAFIGVVTNVLMVDPMDPATYVYTVCVSGYSGAYSVFSTAGGGTEVYVEPGETYYIYDNGQIASRSAIMAESDTHRIAQIGYGVYDPNIPIGSNPSQSALFVSPQMPYEM